MLKEKRHTADSCQLARLSRRDCPTGLSPCLQRMPLCPGHCLILLPYLTTFLALPDLGSGSTGLLRNLFGDKMICLQFLLPLLEALGKQDLTVRQVWVSPLWCQVIKVKLSCVPVSEGTLDLNRLKAIEHKSMQDIKDTAYFYSIIRYSVSHNSAFWII